MQPIYLDHNATTPVDDDVLEAMLPWFSDRFGNASSKRHAYGWAADEAVEAARESVATLVDADPREVTFTSGATEALNLAIRGIAASSVHRGQHLVTVATEHAGVLEPHRTLERAGFEVSVLSVDAEGRVDLPALEAALRADTVLLSVMAANNETGVLHPMAEIRSIAAGAGVPLLCDATQAIGKIPVSIGECDFLALSAHKFYGPKGCGALIRNPRSRRLRLTAQIEGGGQERGLRGGTLNVPAIVGLGAAARIAAERMADDATRWSTMRDRFETSLRQGIDGIRIYGAGTDRLPNTSNFAIPGVASDRIISACRMLAVSTGSACGSGTGRPSHVISAMHGADADVPTTIRVSVGRMTTDDDVTFAAAEIVKAVRNMNDGEGVQGHSRSGVRE